MKDYNKIQIDSKIQHLLAEWHGGQRSSSYSLSSTGMGSKETVEETISELTPLQQWAIRNKQLDLLYLIFRLKLLVK